MELTLNMVCGNCKHWDRGYCPILKFDTCGIYSCKNYEKREKTKRE